MTASGFHGGATTLPAPSDFAVLGPSHATGMTYARTA
jgi:hypothetical protein